MAASTRAVMYALGHTPDELDRLDRQGEILRPLTRRMLEAAGIGPGMRVLDVGCGTGDVSLLVSELVGEQGHVTGIDRAPEAVAAARDRFTAKGRANGTFLQADVEGFASDAPFDAVVGRTVLMYLQDPAAVLRRLPDVVRPGGTIAFVEIILPPAPLFGGQPGSTAARAQGWVTAAFEQAGCATDMGLRQADAFREAGLGYPELRVEAVPMAAHEIGKHRWLAGTVRSLLPLIVKFGIASEAEVEIETLADRLIAEAAAQPGIVLPVAYCGAWVTLPA